MIIVTGGAGFIGSNLVHRLNADGESNILVVDNLTNGAKSDNLSDCEIADYEDKHDFLAMLGAGRAPDRVEAVFHLGACSDTTETDGRYMLANNYSYSKAVLDHCLVNKIPFVYASSASVYGHGTNGFSEERKNEGPLNVYAYSKFLFDQYVRKLLDSAPMPIAGLRYFNVYGPREQHKGAMASVVYHFVQQLLADDRLRLFGGSGGYADGEQRRDFVYVEDVVDVSLWFAGEQAKSGIYNVGTGRSQTFNEVALAVIDWFGRGQIEYIDFPQHLVGAYQHFTEADISALRTVGYSGEFKEVAAGVKAYLDAVNRWTAR